MAVLGQKNPESLHLRGRGPGDTRAYSRARARVHFSCFICIAAAFQFLPLFIFSMFIFVYFFNQMDPMRTVQRSAFCRSRRELSNAYLFLQILASIQPRTSPVKFARSPCTDRSLGAQVLLSTLRLYFFTFECWMRLRLTARLRGRAVLLPLAKDGGFAPGSGCLLLCIRLHSGILAIFSCLVSV